ncbi:MAG: tRNA (adenosine(37)-N6)-threonylcarbamoyltransferase complex ATPase subunit type 1 TsaE [Bacteroidales bacterium]|nr:tRNA (adenosine(37)-N6)-threonylcarbamoyltransferase complex ATPase subunit type 1 TsaE [Bacteroidales bacterium]
MKKQYTLTDLSCIDEVAKSILNDFPNARHFSLNGQMGAGKTTLTKSLCNVLEVEDNVCSPTFAIVNEYYSEKAGTIYHFDFYRIKNLQEAIDIGFDDYIYSGNYCFMEWCENILPLLPDDMTEIKIEVMENQTRVIIVDDEVIL